MTEVIRPVIQFGFEQMGLDRIVATVDPDNERSIRLLMASGFCREVELVDHLACFYLNNPNLSEA
ncbi:hypothetical protein D3C81_2147990 [compost metagenome]